MASIPPGGGYPPSFSREEEDDDELPDQKQDEIRAFASQGLSHADIADWTRVSEADVGRVLNSTASGSSPSSSAYRPQPPESHGQQSPAENWFGGMSPQTARILGVDGHIFPSEATRASTTHLDPMGPLNPTQAMYYNQSTGMGNPHTLDQGSQAMDELGRRHQRGELHTQGLYLASNQVSAQVRQALSRGNTIPLGSETAEGSSSSVSGQRSGQMPQAPSRRDPAARRRSRTSGTSDISAPYSSSRHTTGAAGSSGPAGASRRIDDTTFGRILQSVAQGSISAQQAILDHEITHPRQIQLLQRTEEQRNEMRD